MFFTSHCFSSCCLFKFTCYYSIFKFFCCICLLHFIRCCSVNLLLSEFIALPYILLWLQKTILTLFVIICFFAGVPLLICVFLFLYHIYNPGGKRYQYHLFKNVWPKFLGLSDAKVKGLSGRCICSVYHSLQPSVVEKWPRALGCCYFWPVTAPSRFGFDPRAGQNGWLRFLMATHRYHLSVVELVREAHL